MIVALRESDHTYHVVGGRDAAVGSVVEAALTDGPIVPGVTSVLSATGLSDDYRKVPREVLEHARRRGTAVHEAAWFSEEGDLGSLDPEVEPFLRQWDRFCAESGWHSTERERVVWFCEGGTVLYAGRIDRVGYFDRAPMVPTVLDLSLGDLYAGGKQYQTAAYAEAYRQVAELGPDRQIARVGVRLDRDGYKVEPFRQWLDFRVFRSALHVFAHRYDQ